MSSDADTPSDRSDSESEREPSPPPRKRHRGRGRKEESREPAIVKASNFRVKIPRQSEQAHDQFQGVNWSDLFSTEDGFFKLFLCARTKSGKTTLLWNILKRILNKKQKVLIFARNYAQDAVWKAITELLDKMGVYYKCEPTFKAGFKSKYNLIKTFMDSVRDQDSPDNYVILIDDNGKWNRDDHLEQLLKTNRHLHCSVIVSSQAVTDLNPNSWSDLDFCILFKNQPEHRLKKLHEQMALAIPVEKFMKLYHHATKEPHSFFYVAGNGLEDYRRNFSDRYVV